MSVEINDQKLIDIVYVDDEGNKHKYSGPFINDLTITSEIQEKLTALDTLNIQIGELKTKLETLNTTVTSTGSKIKYTTDLTQYEDDSSIVAVMPAENIPILTIQKMGQKYGWVDVAQLLFVPYQSSFYLSIPSNEDLSQFSISCAGDWSNIQSYKPNILDDIGNIVMSGVTIYANGALTGNNVPISPGSDINMTITDSAGTSFYVMIKPGFKPEE